MEQLPIVLSGNPLFSGLAEEDIRSVLERTGARRMSKKAGERVMRVGDATTEMGIVLSGSVLVVQEDVWGHRNIMGLVPAGDVFAEVFAAAHGAVLNVSVVAHEDSEMLLVDVDRLVSLKGAGACGDVVVRNLIAALARKTMALNEKATHLSKRSTREKLLSYLSAQAQRQGATAFCIELNRQQLADYLCVDRAAMSVELSKLRREGLVDFDRNRFELKTTAHA